MEHLNDLGFSLDDGASDRAFPEAERLTQVGGSIMSEVLDVVLGSPLEDHPAIFESFIGGLHMAVQRIERQADQGRADISRLMRDFDGSEIADTELQEATRKSRACDAGVQAMETMRDAAAAAFTTATGDVWQPYRGSVKASKATAAMIDAKDALRSHKASKHKGAAPGSAVVAFRASPEAVSAEDGMRIFDAMNWALGKYPGMTLATTGLKGAERIAMRWAQQKRVPIVLAKADFVANGRAAPFRANREMMELQPVHVMTLPASLSAAAETATPFGPALNLVEEARKAGIPHNVIMSRRLAA